MVPANRFAMVERPDIPRSRFSWSRRHLSTFQSGKLIPIMAKECLPGDAWRIRMDCFGRMPAFLFPIFEDVYYKTFGFFTPNRLVWDKWERFMGARIPDPDSSIDLLVPQIQSPATGFANFGIYDYLGLPCVGQIASTGTVSVNALPLRMCNLIYNEWFRNQQLQDSLPVNNDSDGPDTFSDYALQFKNKEHDPFTSALPEPQKGPEVFLPFSGDARIVGLGLAGTAGGTTAPPPTIEQTDNIALLTGTVTPAHNPANPAQVNLWIKHDSGEPQIFADLSSVAGAAVSAMRDSFALQQFLEKDNRGGTRYTELLVNHFGVQNEDYRLQRPEYIGGGKGHVQVQAVAQTAQPVSPSTAPVGTLTGASTFSDTHRFNYRATEHGWIIIFVQVSAPKTYYQRLPKEWTRRTRYDYYWPTFAHLSEQAVLREELDVLGTSPGTDGDVFGYQERHWEYRTDLSQMSGYMKGYTTGNIDEWHLAQLFTGLGPDLNDAFIRDELPFSRVLAAGDAANNQQIQWDSVFHCDVVRALPIRGTPGLKTL